jgi:hypothetical protein
MVPQVWATDLWFSVAENMQRIRDAGVEDGAFPIHADARSLPFAPEFFDVIVCIDCFYYFGTDDLYLNSKNAVGGWFPFAAESHNSSCSIGHLVFHKGKYRRRFSIRFGT